MKVKYLILLIVSTLTSTEGLSQAYPTFGPEKEVTITGLSFDAMEPFIAPDGNTLFFNSLNSGGDTNLYYATKVNDSTFNYMGLVDGTYDPSPDHLDAVPSIDALNSFYWVSLRGYPYSMENLHKGTYAGGTVSDTTRVYGDFNIYDFDFPFGWLIMDASINHQGNLLYYCNARFDFNNTTCVGLPCEARLGVAQKVNDSTFSKMPDSEAIFANINDPDYLVYAPQVTADGLELYYTRILIGTFNTEICVATRNTASENFSLPIVIHTREGFAPEAPTITNNKQLLYYHQKDESGVYRIFLRYRSPVTGITEQTTREITVFPNPSTDVVNVSLPFSSTKFSIEVRSSMGQTIYRSTTTKEIDISGYADGVYFLIVKQEGFVWSAKIIRN